MRNRNIRKQVWLNREEASMLKKRAKKCGLSEGVLLRNLITRFEPKEKPDESFYEVLKELRQIGINLNQIAHKANATGNIESELYKDEALKWDQFILDIKKKYLKPDITTKLDEF